MTLRSFGTSVFFGTLLVGAALSLTSCDLGNAGNPLGPSTGAGAGTVTTEGQPTPVPTPAPAPAPTPTPEPDPPSPGPEPDPTPTPPVSEQLMTMLVAAVQDEYHARYTYLAVLESYPGRNPFANIAEAEAQHVVAVSQLFTSRGLPVPASAWNLDNVPRFTTFRAACQGGVQAEIENYTMYETFLAELAAAGPVPKDVGRVFTNLMEASRDQHLPAFTSCAG